MSLHELHVRFSLFSRTFVCFATHAIEKGCPGLVVTTIEHSMGKLKRSASSSSMSDLTHYGRARAPAAKPAPKGKGGFWRYTLLHSSTTLQMQSCCEILHLSRLPTKKPNRSRMPKLLCMCVHNKGQLSVVKAAGSCRPDSEALARMATTAPHACFPGEPFASQP